MTKQLHLPATWRAILAFSLGFFLPGRMRRSIYRALLGYRISPQANLGRAFIRVRMLEMAEGAHIGTLSIIRNVDKVALGKGAIIGTFNWIYGFPSGASEHFLEEGRASELIMEEGTSLTSRHIVDCTNRVTIGAFTTVTGFYSQILTHGIDIRSNRQTSRPVTIGKYCLIGSKSIIVKGAVLPEGTVLSAGSMFRGAPEETHHIYSGAPAVPVRALSVDEPYFTRLKGPVT